LGHVFRIGAIAEPAHAENEETRVKATEQRTGIHVGGGAFALAFDRRSDVVCFAHPARVYTRPPASAGVEGSVNPVTIR
jgi:hypothetical protein